MEEGVYLLRLVLKNVRCFKRNIELDFRKATKDWNNWNIILGNNGTGKSSILQAISVMQMHKELDLVSNRYHYYPTIHWNLKYQDFFYDVNDRLGSKEYISIEVATSQTIDKYRIDIAYSLWNGIGKPDIRIFASSYENFKIYGYGANRFMSRNSISESKTESFDTLFDDDAKLINAEEWLLQLDYSASKSSQIQDFATKRRDQVKEILLEVLPDIEAIRFTEPTKSNLKTTVEFQTPTAGSPFTN